jgi:mannose-6-phosphate isomerase-like protein (cupin superfamily)
MQRSDWNCLLFAFMLIFARGLVGGATAPQTMSTTRAGVRYFAHQEVSAGFSKGGYLYRSGEGKFSIMTARREHGGDSELHQRDTDIFYIVRGSATFVTGGKMVRPRQIGSGELRGAGVDGGQTWRLSTGDVIVIPPGTPHWFKQVSGSILYFVVKVSRQ